MKKVKLLVVDDFHIIRAGIRACLEQAADIEIIGEADNGSAALEIIRQLSPDIVLIDLEMPDLNSLEVVRILKGEKTTCNFLIFADSANPVYIRELFSLGIHGYLLKDEPVEQIVKAIRGIANQEAGWVSRPVAVILSEQLQEDGSPVKALSQREKQVLKYVVEGMSNREIAHALQISKKTVEKHLESIRKKLGVVSRVEAAVVFTKGGLI